MKYKKIRVTAYVLAAAVTFSGMSLTVNAAGADSVLPSGGIGLSIARGNKLEDITEQTAIPDESIIE